LLPDDCREGKHRRHKEMKEKNIASPLKVVEMQFANAQLLPEIIKFLEEGHSVTLQLRGFSMRPFLEDKRDKALLTKPNLGHSPWRWQYSHRKMQA